MLGLLHRTIFYELAKVFLLSLVAITGIIVLAAIVVEASQHGLGPAQILVAIPLIVPSMLPFIIPPTTLFASCVVYGRLAHDNEVIAIKAAGINVLHVVWPGCLLGLTMSVATLGLYIDLIPWTHFVLRSTIVNDAEEYLYTILKRDKQITGRSDVKQSYEIYVEAVQGHLLKNAIFYRKDVATGNHDLIVHAREAELTVDAQNNEVQVHMRNGHLFDASGRSGGFVEDHVWVVPLPRATQRDPTPRDLTWSQLLRARQRLTAELEEAASQVALDITRDAHTALPGNPRKYRAALHEKGFVPQVKLNGVNAELYMRPAMSFGCLFFVMVGCPVGIWFSRSDYLSAFITCFMPIVFIYYPIQLCCTNLAKDGKFVPALDLWAANAVLLVISLYLFRRLLRN